METRKGRGEGGNHTPSTFTKSWNRFIQTLVSLAKPCPSWTASSTISLNVSPQDSLTTTRDQPSHLYKLLFSNISKILLCNYQYLVFDKSQNCWQQCFTKSKGWSDIIICQTLGCLWIWLFMLQVFFLILIVF